MKRKPRYVPIPRGRPIPPAQLPARELGSSRGNDIKVDGMASPFLERPIGTQWLVEVYITNQKSWMFHSWHVDKTSAQSAMKSEFSLGHRARHKLVPLGKIGGAGLIVDPLPGPGPSSIELERLLEITRLQLALRSLWSREGRVNLAMPGGQQCKPKLLQLIEEAQARLASSK